MPARPDSSLRFLLPFAVVLLLVAGVVFSLTHAGAEQLAATYTHGNLHVTIPYHSAQAGSGKLVAEILDPEDHVLGRAERTVGIAKGDGSWQQVITPAKPIPYEDIIWQRIRYRFEYNGNDLPAIEGIESISQILRRPVVHILGQTQYLAGSQAAIRVIVSDANNNDICRDRHYPHRTPYPESEVAPALLRPPEPPRHCRSSVSLSHGPHGQVRDALRRGHTDRLDRIHASPSNLKTRHPSSSRPKSPSTSPARPSTSVLSHSIAPITRPKLTRKLTFELEDSRGNKVFKKSTATDKFGIASAEFSLADEVNLGTYHLRALMGDALLLPTPPKLH